MGLMVETTRSGELHDFHLASRKAEEAVLRRYQAVHWLECVVGPLGIPAEPSERDFISCLRNGIILCNVINKIQPGCIPKVVENNEPIASESTIWDSKPLPAYQYFENVRNFLMAVKQLKLPAFEASDLERENFEAESAGRIADCILALKSYHEWKEWSGGNGVYKHVNVKSPLVLQSSAKSFSRPSNMISADKSSVDEKQFLTDSIVKSLANHLVESKENINANFLSSLQNGSQDQVQIFSEILSRCLKEKLEDKFPMLKHSSQDSLGKAGGSRALGSVLKENVSLQNTQENLEDTTRKGNGDRWRMLQNQERDLSNIKALWHKTKTEFEDFQTHLLNDLIQLGNLVEEMSGPALGYQKVIQENRKLYNMAQDLKGNVRVYCRIRPMIDTEAMNVVDFVGQDGSLGVMDPSKTRLDGRKVFQFNQVYGPTATQDELFKEIQPLIRSVMDGYNVCILAYGQTASGKTHTMYGSEKETGMNFLALNDLFQNAGRRLNVTYDVRVQMVTIYNEQVQDLLVEDSASDGESSLVDITFRPVKSHVDAIELVKSGERKHISKINSLSCHSHSVVAIHVQGKDTAGNVLRGCLHLVDLAASGEDDKSVAEFEEVIASFSQKTPNIRQRNSKITSLLQDDLGRNAKVVVLAHVIPDGDKFAETISTLRFAQKISSVKLGAAQSNRKNIEVMELKEEIEILKSALGEKDARSPKPNRQLRSPCDKARPIIEKTPIKSRRLSIESMKSDKLEKSPLSKPRPTEKLPNGTTGSSKDPKSPSEKLKLDRSYPRSRRLSIENPTMVRSEKKQKLKEPKTPQRTRRLSIENPNSMKPIADIRKSTKTPQASLRARRLSLEGPKNLTTKDRLHSAEVVISSKDYISIMEFPKSPPPVAVNRPTFTDCATRFPTVQQTPKTPKQQKHDSNEKQTPSIAKRTNKKGSQIKRSLRTIGKLINGSEKRNQQKAVESPSINNVREAKSPTTAKVRALRRQSLTGLPPPPGSDRRSSLGSTTTDARLTDGRNAKTPPSMRSSTKITSRWM